MTSNTSQELFDELDSVLEAERQALLTGSLDKIGKMLERKEQLIEDLSILEEFDSNHLQDLTGKMKRNQALLDSALEGIRTVANRLAELRRVQSTLDTYTSNGKKQSIDIRKDGIVEKRA